MVRTLFVHIAGALAFPFLLVRKTFFFVRHKTGISERIAIRKANQLAAETGYKYIVFRAGGKTVIKPKKLLKSMIACPGKYFAKGTTIQDIEKRALYITQ
jgi:hypothetical protein